MSHLDVHVTVVHDFGGKLVLKTLVREDVAPYNENNIRPSATVYLCVDVCPYD